jgi:glutamate dehydrogenase/leucine dehydrogenase
MTTTGLPPIIAAHSVFTDDPGRRSAVFQRLLQIAPLVNPAEGTLGSLERADEYQHHQIRLGDRLFDASRVHDNNVLAQFARLLGYRGLDYKGGIRFDEGATFGKNRELAFEMTLKLAVSAPSFDPADSMERGAIIAMGGGKGVIQVDPSTLSTAEVDHLTSEYGRLFAPFLAGPNAVGSWEPIDVPAPDVNTGGHHMKILLDRYSEAAGRQFWSVYTGKRIPDGGIAGRDEATARGGFIVLQDILRRKEGIEGNPFQGRTFAIDGFGNAGTFMARIVTQHGGRVIAFSDSKGAIRAGEDGFSVEELERLIDRKTEEKMQRTRLLDRNLSKEDLLALPVDVLVLAATNLTLTEKNAESVRAKYLIELGNGMTDAAADEILNARGATLIPDGAGGLPARRLGLRPRAGLAHPSDHGRLAGGLCARPSIRPLAARGGGRQGLEDRGPRLSGRPSGRIGPGGLRFQRPRRPPGPGRLAGNPGLF